MFVVGDLISQLHVDASCCHASPDGHIDSPYEATSFVWLIFYHNNRKVINTHMFERKKKHVIQSATMFFTKSHISLH